MLKKIFLTIGIIIVLLIGYFVFKFIIPSPFINSPINAEKFILIDGDTRLPIKNQNITVCDDTMRITIAESQNFNACDFQAIHGKTKTNEKGEFSLNIKNVDSPKDSNIIFDLGEEYYIVSLSKQENTIIGSYNPSYIRLLNQNKTGKVISNKFYNLDTREIREVFLDKSPEKISKFDIIELTTYKLTK